MGKAMMTMLGLLGELESTIKSERTGAWQDHRRTVGAVPTGPTPYGYRREPNQLIVVPEQADNIRGAAAALLDGASLYSIIAEWNGQGGRQFTRRALTHIVTSATTAGLREVDDGVFVASDAWEPILDRDTWEQVRALFDGRKGTMPGPRRRWLLSGLLRCGRPDADTGEPCGTPMRAHPDRRHPRYRCPACDVSISANDTNEVIERGLLDALDPKAWKRLRRRGGQPADTAALEERLAQLAEMVAAHEITEAEWEIRRTGIIRDLADAAAEPVALPDVDDVRKAWPELDLDARRLVVAAVFPRIVINRGVPGRNTFDETRIVIHPTGNHTVAT
jgi:hypothetical protein